MSSNYEMFTRMFEQDRDDPEGWAFSAGHLRIAADLLFQAYQERCDPDGDPVTPEHEVLDAPAAMLLGYAFENMIKGYLIKMHGGFDKAKNLHEAEWNHCLVKLANRTGIPLQEDQKLLLGSLQAFVMWAGRYPVPLRRHAATIRKQRNAGDDLPPFAPMRSEIELLDQFFSRMEDDILGSLRSRMKTPGELADGGNPKTR